MNDPIPMADEVLGPETLGDDPRVTPTIAGGETVPGGEVDASGVPFDPAIHERGRKADGTWKAKRGQAARKAKGLPMHLPTKDGGSIVRIPERVTPSQATTTDDAGGALDALPVSTITPEDCMPTAKGVVGAVWAIARMVMGPDWKPSSEERSRQEEAVARAWADSALPRLSGWLEVLVLGGESVGERIDKPETQTRWQRFLEWTGIRKPEKKPEE